MTIKFNAIECRHCGTIAMSTHVHNMEYCECGKVAADGGKEYLRRAFQTLPENDFIELSETTDAKR